MMNLVDRSIVGKFLGAGQAVDIDVLIPVFNGDATLERSIESIRSQSLPPRNIIIVDDGSTDSTPEILADLQQRDASIKVVTQCNGGIVDALNNGLAHASSSLVARHDADDLADPERFRLQADYLSAHPDCVAVSGAYRYIDDAGRATGETESPASLPGADPCWIPSREPFLSHPFLTVRRDALLEVGGYRYLFHSEDTDLYWRLKRKGKLHNLTEILGSYRMHDQSISGASILNARIMALNSQLGALSARRVEAGDRDLDFPRERRAAFEAAGHLDAMLAVVSPDLSESELGYLRLACAAKMMELASYRPYELQLEDCRFIREALETADTGISAENEAALLKQVAATAARLMRLRQYPAAAALLPATMYPQALLRALTGRLYWKAKQPSSGVTS
jgi:GT2 family glycosyltransferase